MKMIVSEIQIVILKPKDGLLGFASCVINNQFFLGNIAIHDAPSSEEGFRLVFPNKKLVSGQVVDCFHPISKEAESAVSSAIIKKFVELMGNFQNS